MTNEVWNVIGTNERENQYPGATNIVYRILNAPFYFGEWNSEKCWYVQAPEVRKPEQGKGLREE